MSDVSNTTKRRVVYSPTHIAAGDAITAARYAYLDGDYDTALAWVGRAGRFLTELKETADAR